MLYYKNNTALVRAMKENDLDGTTSSYKLYASGRESKFIDSVNRDQMLFILKTKSFNRDDLLNLYVSSEINRKCKVDIVDYTLTSDNKIFPSGERKMDEYREDKLHLFDRLFTPEEYEMAVNERLDTANGKEVEKNTEDNKNTEVYIRNFFVKHKDDIAKALSRSANTDIKIGESRNITFKSKEPNILGGHEYPLCTAIACEDIVGGSGYCSCKMYLTDATTNAYGATTVTVELRPFAIETNNFSMLYKIACSSTVYVKGVEIKLSIGNNNRIINAEVKGLNIIKDLRQNKDIFRNTALFYTGNKVAAYEYKNIAFNYDSYSLVDEKDNHMQRFNCGLIGWNETNRMYNNLMVVRELNTEEVKEALEYFEECIKNNWEVPEGIYSAIKYGIENKRDYIKEACTASYKTPDQLVNIMNTVKVGPINNYTNKSFFDIALGNNVKDINFLYNTLKDGIRGLSERYEKQVAKNLGYVYRENNSGFIVTWVNKENSSLVHEVSSKIDINFGNTVNNKAKITINLGDTQLEVNGDTYLVLNNESCASNIKMKLMLKVKSIDTLNVSNGVIDARCRKHYEYPDIAGDDSSVFEIMNIGSDYPTTKDIKLYLSAKSENNFNHILERAGLRWTYDSFKLGLRKFNNLSELYDELCKAFTDDRYYFVKCIYVESDSSNREYDGMKFDPKDSKLKNLYTKVNEYIVFCKQHNNSVPDFFTKNLETFKKISDAVAREESNPGSFNKRVESSANEHVGLFGTLRSLLR